MFSIAPIEIVEQLRKCSPLSVMLKEVSKCFEFCHKCFKCQEKVHASTSVYVFVMTCICGYDASAANISSDRQGPVAGMLLIVILISLVKATPPSEGEEGRMP